MRPDCVLTLSSSLNTTNFYLPSQDSGSANQRPVFRSRDPSRPTRGQYWRILQSVTSWRDRLNPCRGGVQPGPEKYRRVESGNISGREKLDIYRQKLLQNCCRAWPMMGQEEETDGQWEDGKLPTSATGWMVTRMIHIMIQSEIQICPAAKGPCEPVQLNVMAIFHRAMHEKSVRKPQFPQNPMNQTNFQSVKALFSLWG